MDIFTIDDRESEMETLPSHDLGVRLESPRYMGSNGTAAATVTGLEPTEVLSSSSSSSSSSNSNSNMHGVFETTSSYLPEHVRRLIETRAGQRASQLASSMWRALTWRLLLLLWAVLVFLLLCVTASRSGKAPQLSLKSCPPHAVSNECERGLLLDGDTCLRLPVVNGKPCSKAPCHISTVGSLGPHCREGRCETDRCAGDCDRALDCPVLQIRGQSKRASCTWHSCIYMEQAQLPVASTDCTTGLFGQFCASLVHDEVRDCLLIDPICEAGQLVCVFSYKCAKATWPQPQ
jgi:hypothetical protein